MLLFLTVTKRNRNLCLPIVRCGQYTNQDIIRMRARPERKPLEMPFFFSLIERNYNIFLSWRNSFPPSVTDCSQQKAALLVKVWHKTLSVKINYLTSFLFFLLFCCFFFILQPLPFILLLLLATIFWNETSLSPSYWYFPYYTLSHFRISCDSLP